MNKYHDIVNIIQRYLTLNKAVGLDEDRTSELNEIVIQLEENCSMEETTEAEWPCLSHGQPRKKNKRTYTSYTATEAKF